MSNTYRFAYAYQNQPGEINIALVGFPMDSNAVNTIKLPVEKAWTLATVAKNSGGTFIALVFQNGADQVVALFNSITYEMHTIATDVTLAVMSDTAMDSLPSIIWSPDGQYLALNLFQPHPGTTIDTSTTDLFIYSVLDNTLTALTHDENLHTALAWSPDSRQLAVTTVVHCPKDCDASIDVFDSQTKKSVTSIPITPDAFGANSAGGAGVCHLNWSPDARYISFMANCDAVYSGYYREIYMLEIAAQKLTRVTNFSYNQDVKAQNGFVFADYQTLWLDQNNLLISAAYGIANKVFETLLYNVETGQLTQISHQYVQEWAENPYSHTLAFQNVGTNPNDYHYPSRSQPINFVSFDSVSPPHTSTDELSSLTTLNKGCDLRWSPDGKRFAYTVPQNDICGAHISSFVFLNYRSSEITTYTPDFVDRMPLIDFVIGWVSG